MGAARAGAFFWLGGLAEREGWRGPQGKPSGGRFWGRGVAPPLSPSAAGAPCGPRSPAAGANSEMGEKPIPQKGEPGTGFPCLFALFGFLLQYHPQQTILGGGKQQPRRMGHGLPGPLVHVFGGFKNAGQNGGYQKYHFNGNEADMDDILKNLFGGGHFKGGFGGTGSSGRRSYSSSGFGSGFGQGADGYSSYSDFGSDYGSGFGTGADEANSLDVKAEVTVSFDEAAFGANKRVRLQGSDGKVQTLEIKIPAGIDTGKTIRLKGKGNVGRNGRTGDLLLKVTVQDKLGFRREGMDVYTTVQIPFTTAVFGGEARIQTIHGDVICKIKPGTQSGSKIRLRGKGIVSMKDSKVFGDQYAVVEIQVPTTLTPQAARKLREFEAECAKTSGTSNGTHAA